MSNRFPQRNTYGYWRSNENVTTTNSKFTPTASGFRHRLPPFQDKSQWFEKSPPSPWRRPRPWRPRSRVESTDPPECCKEFQDCTISEEITEEVCPYCVTPIPNLQYEGHLMFCSQQEKKCHLCNAVLSISNEESHLCNHGVLHPIFDKEKSYEKPPDRKDAGTNTSPEDDSLLLSVDPLTDKDDNQTVLSKDFEALHNNQRFADVILKLGELKFPAHKLVLRCRSKIFEAMFEHDMQENQQDTVDLVDMEDDTVRDMLRYIYCGKVRQLSPKEALSLYVAADRYDLQELVLYCRKIVLSTLSIDNICDISTVADLHSDKLLMNAVKSLLSKDVKAVLRTDKWITYAKENPVFCLNLIQTALLNK